MEKVGFNPDLLLETKNWNPSSRKKFNMAKDQVVNIPSAMLNFKIGLGLDTTVDIDCSVLLMDADGELLENIFYANLNSNCGGV